MAVLAGREQDPRAKGTARQDSLCIGKRFIQATAAAQRWHSCPQTSPASQDRR